MESIGKLQCFRQDPSYRLLKENTCLSKKALLNQIGFDQEVLECFPVLRLRGNAGKPWFLKGTVGRVGKFCQCTAPKDSDQSLGGFG